MDACLIAIAVRASKFRLILAANRDEDFDRPTLPAAFWGDAPGVLGGRDALHLGSWLAITRAGRFAAVTNLRGSVRDPRKRSRGELVSDFVRGTASPREYIEEIDRRADEYSGFHLIAGDLRGEVIQSGGSPPLVIEGIHALSNAPAGERWPKVDLAEQEMRSLARIEDHDELVARTLRFLASPLGTRQVQNEVFIAGERYGTRSSTVIVATADQVTFVEQSYAPHGVPEAVTRRFQFAYCESTA